MAVLQLRKLALAVLGLKETYLEEKHCRNQIVETEVIVMPGPVVNTDLVGQKSH